MENERLRRENAFLRRRLDCILGEVSTCLPETGAAALLSEPSPTAVVFCVHVFHLQTIRTISQSLWGEINDKASPVFFFPMVAGQTLPESRQAAHEGSNIPMLRCAPLTDVQRETASRHRGASI